MNTNRAKPSKHGPGKQTSVTFPPDLLEFLDELSDKTGMNRSALVCLIVRYFRDSGTKIRFVIEQPEESTERR